MVINHNISALNTYNQLSKNEKAQQSSLAKLSSGLRINSAADDAAGLAISQKMQAQINGLDQSTQNAQNGISMVQTAEGALNETQSILQRMNTLAVQSANDTNQSTDRGQIQKEMDQLAQEITRIANDTEFNSQKLINGGISTTGIGQSTFQIGANAGQTLSISIGAMDAKTLGVSRDVMGATVSGATDVTGAAVSGTPGTAITDGASLTLSASTTAAKGEWTAANSGLTGVTLDTTANSSEYNGYTLTVKGDGSSSSDPAAAIDASAKTITITLANDYTTTAAGIDTALNTAFSNAGIDLTATFGTGGALGTLASGKAITTKGLANDEVALTVGSETQTVKKTATSVSFTSAANQGLTLTLDGSLTSSTAATIAFKQENASAATFSGGAKTADAVAYAGLDVTTQTAASSAITAITAAIDTVSTQRAQLGAYQNRLDHTINNLTTESQNLTSASSAITDVDMAKEMTNYTKNNILNQAAQAMLAQANQLPQGILQLLK